ncbi:MAG: four helix bundle protein [Bacteroidales bacterium]|jgi:four helix bundle protein|nr:four helix bundle protein [Bacteroidales bacterium]
MNYESSKYKRVNLEDRLIDFSINIIELIEKLPKSNIGLYLKDQLTRSSASPAFNYGEAQSAESSRDFIHKMKICLKELRETRIGLKYIFRGKFSVDSKLLEILLNESNELISIFVKSIQTAKKNMEK